MMRTIELDYELPQELIAQHPCERRDGSRLLVLDRSSREMCVDSFCNVGHYLRAGDCLVANDTKVIRARLHGRKPTGGVVEMFLLKEIEAGRWTALVRPSARVASGARVVIGGGIEAMVGEILPEGRREVVFDTPNVIAVLEKAGEIPLPPYIRRDHPEEADLTRYQTVYARNLGAVAAPTAGLHFTDSLLEQLALQGVTKTFVTLHVGYGTFKPIQVDTLEEHVVDSEEFCVSKETASLLNETRTAGGRVVAVGTTTARVLETQYREGEYCAGSGSTSLYIHPPYTFGAVDCLQTNFHLPKSSLLALVCAFAGTDFVLEAYRLAVKKQFRFYSYGDAMLIL